MCWFLPTSQTHTLGAPQGTGLQEGAQESVLPPSQARPVPEPDPKSLGWDESGVT